MEQRDLFADWPFELDAQPMPPRLRVVPAASRLVGIAEIGGEVRVMDPLPEGWMERSDLVTALQVLCEEYGEPDPEELREAELVRLGELALAQGLASLNAGGPFTPFLLSQGPQGHGLERFCSSSLREARQAAHERARASSEPVSAYAFVYDGLLPQDGRWMEALFVEVAERGAGEGRRLAQPIRLTPQAASLGPAMCVGPCERWG